MTVPAPTKKTQTMLEREIRIFREQVERIINCFLNKLFDLSQKGYQRRFLILVLMTFAFGAFLSLRSHTFAEWQEQLRMLFQFFFNPLFRQANQSALENFILFSLGPVFAPQSLRLLPLLVLPFIIALQYAAIYLADIFEIEKVEIARAFIRRVALTGTRQKIRIGKGEVADKDKNSPIYLIGGPGQVIVELDTVAVFEKPNGQPHVIGPTVKKTRLEGFERFRRAIDLRDQYTDPLDVGSRSLDGIRVKTNDVRFVYSVSRKGKSRTAKHPHPFGDDKVIEDLVYGQSSMVVDGDPPSKPPEAEPLFAAINRLIRANLNNFMSQHRLADYLAAIGPPEVERARQQENDILEVGQEVIADQDSLQPRVIPPPPEFQTRSVVKNLFNKFVDDVAAKTSIPGVQLSWIGVGTWNTPDEIVPEKHIEAWRLSSENLLRGAEDKLNKLRNEAHLQQVLRLIQNIPLARFQQTSDMAHQDNIKALLIAYREQFLETVELLKKSDRRIPGAIEAAVKHIEGVLGHWVAEADQWSVTDSSGVPADPGPMRLESGSTTGVPSIPPISEEEMDLYQDLSTLVGNDPEQVEALIENERKNAPNADLYELLQRAVAQFQGDN